MTNDPQQSTNIRLNLLLAAMMSACMSLFFSGFFTFLALGPTWAWLLAWAKGFAIAWPLGFVIAVLIGAPVRHLAMRWSNLP